MESKKSSRELLEDIAFLTEAQKRVSFGQKDITRFQDQIHQSNERLQELVEKSEPLHWKMFAYCLVLMLIIILVLVV